MTLRPIHISSQVFLLAIEFGIYKLKLVSSRRYGVLLAKRFEKMGGAFVKIGQLLSVRPDIISYEVADQLYPLLQNLKPVSADSIRKKIREQLSDTKYYEISSLESSPIATGSIAQVHKIKFKNGDAGVIKVLKPKITKHLDSDMKMFRFFMKAGSFIPGLKKLPLQQLASDMDPVIRRQLDLREEMITLAQFRKNFSNNPDIHFPKPLDYIISSELVAMDYLVLPADIDFNSWPQEKRSAVARKALAMLYQMMFKDGLTHCDLHPGNFFVTQEGNFILLDFGMVATMTDEFRKDFIRFFFYMATNNSIGCTEIVEKTALYKARDFSHEKLQKEIHSLISKFSAMNAENFSVIDFTKSLINVERKCGIKGSTAFISNILAIAFFESKLKKIDPTIDFQEEAVNYLMQNSSLIDLTSLPEFN